MVATKRRIERMKQREERAKPRSPAVPRLLAYFSHVNQTGAPLTTTTDLTANPSILLRLPTDVMLHLFNCAHPSSLDSFTRVNRELRAFALREISHRLHEELKVSTPSQWWLTPGGRRQLVHIFRSRFFDHDPQFACSVCFEPGRALVHPFFPQDKPEVYLCDLCWTTNPKYRVISVNDAVKKFGLSYDDRHLIPYYLFNNPPFQSYSHFPAVAGEKAKRHPYYREADVLRFLAENYDENLLREDRRKAEIKRIDEKLKHQRMLESTVRAALEASAFKDTGPLKNFERKYIHKHILGEVFKKVTVLRGCLQNVQQPLDEVILTIERNILANRANPRVRLALSKWLAAI
ncbi:hypothetical protein BC938DRAFT_473085 [Jimgerdemannia flammicorona]|uniref:F-box domain-containing protein n=1 Tax=Jimgerdemannia flammicorona TaxID=994334 RepID=A0A433Q4N0_9FUNG|nr:hypothetical protein BC938DRAFT_473085 [Jimgerdemannia flammicorona]